MTDLDFRPFGSAVAKQYAAMQKHELFVVDFDRDAIWAHYLASFPPGTNEVFRKLAHHDCSCCKDFIRKVGTQVAIINGEIVTVWDIAKIDAPYDTVSNAMAVYVRNLAMKTVFRTKEKKISTASNDEQTPAGRITHHHFSATIDDKHRVTTSASVDEVLGKLQTKREVFERGLSEITPAAVAEVLDLINDKNIYRGAEHKAAVTGFKKLQDGYLAAGNQKELFVWQSFDSKYAAIKNTVIGSLLMDLSDGKGLEKAVKAFEAKVAPANYKRKKTLVSAKQIAADYAKLVAAGYEGALKRRHANFADVKVTDVLFADRSVKPKMQDGLLGDLLQSAVDKPADIKGAKDISIDDFLEKVLPNAASVDMLVEGQHRGNFVSITAPEGVCEKDFFKWDNNFGWSYLGGLADSDLREQVAARGGRVDGAFRFSHQWNYAARNASLMDLHVFMPGCNIKAGNRTGDSYGNHERVGWNNRKHGPSRGKQDVDYTDPAPEGYVPVENITFPSLSRMPDGEYICKIHNWQLRTPNQGGFKAEIEFNGEIFQYEYEKPLKQKEWIEVAVVTKKGNNFTIEHSLPTTATATKEIWGVKTNTLVAVDSVVLSPNHWGENKAGNKHWFFILRNCLNPEPTRGFYNEFVTADLHDQSRTLELIAEKTQCEPVADQMSGLGFSSTIKKDVKVIVKGEKGGAYNIKFNA